MGTVLGIRKETSSMFELMEQNIHHRSGQGIGRVHQEGTSRGGTFPLFLSQEEEYSQVLQGWPEDLLGVLVV